MLKKININPSLVGEYPIQGVDVSHYQGEIEWEQFREQGIDFAFIKATEGSSFDSLASSQAEHFIATAGDLSGTLPPTVDIEYYGDQKELEKLLVP